MSWWGFCSESALHRHKFGKRVMEVAQGWVLGGPVVRGVKGMYWVCKMDHRDPTSVGEKQLKQNWEGEKTTKYVDTSDPL